MLKQSVPITEGSRGNAVEPVNNWIDCASTYRSLIEDKAFDSAYLREVGLERNLIEMIGSCGSLRVLDVGCGTGWLFDNISPSEAHQCDIFSSPLQARSNVVFSQTDCRDLCYQSNYFDLLVASLLLMWFPELDTACGELYRVCKPGGRLVISLVHPYFYRTGDIDDDGNFTVTHDLSSPFLIEDHMIGGVAGPLKYYYRPVGSYLNCLIQAGWTLSRMNEWFVDMHDYYRVVKSNTRRLKRTGRVPMYLFIECRKS